jgi:hypothetical protein
MSKHIGRKQAWTETSSLRHDSAFGFVKKNTEGKWDAYVIYHVRSALGSTPKLRPWKKREEIIGEHKRAREAMMAVETKVKELKNLDDEDVLI